VGILKEGNEWRQKTILNGHRSLRRD
jgi:hypothetical protein